jgi:hypothetical protein
MKCRSTPPTPRARFFRGLGATALSLASLSAGAGLAAPQQGILPPRDAATRPFLEGRDLVEKRRWAEAVPKLREALATGHEKPQERFGTSRHSVDYYDPHYWLGRALMELGDEEGALVHLRASASEGLFPDRRETADRSLRLAELERRERARREPPAPEVPTPLPLPTAALPAPTPTPEPAAPGPGADAEPDPPLPLPAAAPGAVPTAPASSPPEARLNEALAALAAGDFDRAAERVRAERRRTPGARELDLVEAAALGGRYVLEGRRDDALLDMARERLAAFRGKGGSARAEATLLSPSLRALLEPR